MRELFGKYMISIIVNVILKKKTLCCLIIILSSIVKEACRMGGWLLMKLILFSHWTRVGTQYSMREENKVGH